jgi:hypothetical protein
MGVLLVALGLFGCLVVEAAVVTWLQRRSFAGLDGAFRCKLRVRAGRLDGLSHRWPVWCADAVWAQAVLVVVSGLLRLRVIAVPDAVLNSAAPVPGSEVSGLGGAPVSITLKTHDHVIVELAAARADMVLLAGPSAVAAAI